jgi:hypothetical protein
MTVLRIKWAGYCPACNSDELDVNTDNGTPERLFEGDDVTCSQCGLVGAINCEDDTAFAVWDWGDN